MIHNVIFYLHEYLILMGYMQIHTIHGCYGMGFIKCLSHDMYQPWLVDFEVGGYAAPFTGVIKLPCLEGSIQICMYIYIYGNFEQILHKSALFGLVTGFAIYVHAAKREEGTYDILLVKFSCTDFIPWYSYIPRP